MKKVRLNVEFGNLLAVRNNQFNCFFTCYSSVITAVLIHSLSVWCYMGEISNSPTPCVVWESLLKGERFIMLSLVSFFYFYPLLNLYQEIFFVNLFVFQA